MLDVRMAFYVYISFDSQTFRKIFPEYVEKYNQQQLSEQHISEQVVPEHPKDGNTGADKDGNTAGAQVKNLNTPKDMRRNRKQSFPTWMMLLLISIFGLVMALPLLQL